MNKVFQRFSIRAVAALFLGSNAIAAQKAVMVKFTPLSHYVNLPPKLLALSPNVESAAGLVTLRNTVS